MKARRIRVWLTWPVILLFVAALAGALALVWAADGRQWYLEGVGIDARLDLVFSGLGRWLATVVLATLAALGLAALLFDLLSLRRAPVPASTEYPGGAYPDAPSAYRLDRPATSYAGVMVGGDDTQRMEGLLPVTPTERVPSPSVSDDTATVRASLDQIQRQLDALRSRIDRSEAPHERVTAGR
jgi:hypothetical protein